MALVREIMGSSLMEKSSFLGSSGFLVNRKQNQFCSNTVLVPAQKKRIQVKRASRVPNLVAAISENLDLVKVVPEKAVKFKVRAVVTVRNKHKEDLKETIAKHLDALTDKIGRNVVLELVSTDIDPKTKGPKKSNQAVLKDWSEKSNLKTERVHYIAEFVVDSDFGILERRS